MKPKHLLTLLACALLHAHAPAFAAAPSASVPGGIFRTNVGALEVTALGDGVGSLPIGVLQGDASFITGLLGEDGIAGANFPATVNAYLVKSGGKFILVDTGSGGNWGLPELGHVVTNLRAAGVRPDQVDLVLIPHLHADHVGGLVTASGAAVFPKAVVRVAQADSDFWLSEKIAAGAPAEARDFFKVARKSAAPYLKSGHWQPFKPGETVAPGVEALAMPGHTPGHTGFQFSSNGQQLLVWGDVVHAVQVQMIHPEVAMAFDSDQATAVTDRKRLFAALASGNALVAGAHLPFPGLGRVKASGASYRWIAAPYPSPTPN